MKVSWDGQTIFQQFAGSFRECGPIPNRPYPVSTNSPRRATTAILRIAVASVLLALSASAADTDAKQRTKAIRDLAKSGSTQSPNRTIPLGRRHRRTRGAVRAIVDLDTQYSLDPLVKQRLTTNPKFQIRATDGLVNFYLPAISERPDRPLKRAGTAVKSRFTTPMIK